MKDPQRPQTTSLLLVFANPAGATPKPTLILHHQAGRLLLPARTTLTVQALPATPDSQLSNPKQIYVSSGVPALLAHFGEGERISADIVCHWEEKPFRFFVQGKSPQISATLIPHLSFQPTTTIPTQARARRLLGLTAGDRHVVSCQVDGLDLTALDEFRDLPSLPTLVAAVIATLYAPEPAAQLVRPPAPVPAL